MLDAGTVGENLPQGETRHWLVNGVKVSGMCIPPFLSLAAVDKSTGSSVTNTSAVGITDYAGPAPASGSGPHRYTTWIRFMV